MGLRQGLRRALREYVDRATMKYMEKSLRTSLTEIASRQRGLFSAAQATQLGASYAQLMRAESKGELRRVTRGVYAISGAPPSAWEPLVAVALLAGPGAVVSHGSAAAVHRFEYGTPLGVPSFSRVAASGRLEAGAGPLVEVTFLPGARSHRPLKGAVTHFATDLGERDIVERRGILVTAPPRTLVDLAGRLGPVLTEKVLDEGLLVRRWSVAEVAESLGRARFNLAGRAHLAQLLALRSEEPSADSALEMAVYRALRELMPFEVHYCLSLEGYEFVLDAAWPPKKVAAEIVGRSHRVASRSAFDKERLKLNILAKHGWKLAHLTATMKKPEIVGTVSALLALADRELEMLAWGRGRRRD
jgi:hypothetical protein